MAERIIHKTFKFRIYPTKAQAVRLEETLALCAELYNAALQERKDAWQLERKFVAYFDQTRQLADIRKTREDLAGVHSDVLGDTLKRVACAFDGFFRELST